MNKKLALSDRDKKNSAKKKQKVVLKNLLAQPFERYWPELIAADVEHFARSFRSLYKSGTSNNSTSNAETITTSTSSSHQNVTNDKNMDFANQVVIGLRSSIRYVSSGNRVVLFISSKIRPKYIVDQIIIMTLTKNPNSKIFCVPEMSSALLDVLGFSCQCLAIVNDKNEIWNWALEKSKQFPVPKSLHKSKAPKVEQMNVEHISKPSIGANECEEFDVSALYLRKGNSTERAFIPHGTILTSNSSNDFISLGDTNVQIETIRPKHQMISQIQRREKLAASKLENVFSEKISFKKKTHNQQQFNANKVNYLSLKVNRVQPNPQKIRNKNKKNKKNKK